MTRNYSFSTKLSKQFGQWLVTLVLIAFSTVNVNAQLSGVKSIPGDYATIANAVTDLNAQGVGAGGVIFNVNPSHFEFAPAGGINLTATGTFANPITFQKLGAGVNPLIIAPVGTILLTTTSTVVDGIFSFNGSDYVTIDGIDLVDNNAGGVDMMEYGYGFFKVDATDGCQNNTIKNCVITLNKTNNVAGTTTFFQDGCKGIYFGNIARTAMTTDLVVSTIGGRNNGNTITGNTIQNVFQGIYMRGYGDGGSPYSNLDQNNSIGGNSAALGNIIRNFGTGTITTFGIVTFNQNNLLVQYNNINNLAGGGSVHGATILGMSISGSFATNNSSYNIRNNTISLGQGTNTNQTQGISVGAAGGNGTVNITDNLITGFTNTSGATAGAVFGTVVSNTVGATLNITGNVYSNNQLSNAANFISLQSTATAVTANITGNSFLNNTVSNNGASSNIMITNAAAITGALNISNNIIDGLTYNVASSTSQVMINTTAGAATCVLTISNNSFQNINYLAASSHIMTFINNTAATLSQNISGNTFINLNLNTTNSVTFMSNSVALSASGTCTVNNNSIVTAFNKGGAGGTVSGYLCSTAPSSVTGAVKTYTGNNFSNGTVTGTTTVNIWTDGDGAPGPTKNITNNTFSNWNCGSGTVTVLQTNWSGGGVVSGNVISNITGTGAIVGISRVSGGVADETVSNNTISGLISSGTGGNVTGITGGSTGITNYNINNNTINNLSSTGVSSSVIAINVTAGLTTNIFLNTINNLSGSGTSSPLVRGIAISSGTTANVYRNKIYDLAENGVISTTNSAVNGILISGGTTVNAYNNLIGDLRTPNATLTDAIRAISITSTTGSTNYNIYYNTININATSVGANFGTTGIFHTTSATATTAALNLRNNIIVNTSTAAGTGLTVAYRRSSGAANTLANYSASSNNNDFYAGTPSATNLIYWDGTSSAQTLAQYKGGVFTAGTIAPRDGVSVNEDPGFQSTAGANANFLKYNTGVAKQIESGAVNIAGITDDFFATIRQGNGGYAGTGGAPDMGAWELEGISADLSAPAISYSILGNTSCTLDRTFTATITDASGVDIAPGTKPRLYYKKSGDANDFVGNTNADNGWKYVEATNAVSPFSFTTNYALLQGPVGSADVIQYFVVAQDMAAVPNVGINNGTFALAPSSVALASAQFPLGGTINSYTIGTAGISGLVTIGATGTYTSLTGVGGLFSVINSGGISGAITAEIIDASVAETGANALNAVNYNGCIAGPYNITIKPASGVTATLVTSSATPSLIKLNGARNVIIDGSNNGTSTRDLTLENSTNTTNTAVIWVSSLGTGLGATDNTIKNCNIKAGNNGSASNSFGIYVAGASISTAGTGANNNNLTIHNNSISKAYYGIYAQGIATTGINQNLVITGNSIGSNSASDYVTFRALLVSQANNANVSQNTVFNMITTEAIVLRAMEFGAGVTNTSISKNKITNVEYIGGGFRAGQGISVNTVNPANITIDNNMISGLKGHGSGTMLNNSLGIAILGGGGYKVYYNSVNISDNRVATGSTDLHACMYVGSGVTFLDVRNNIFSMTAMAGNATLGKTYAIYSLSANTAFSNINYNDYYAPGTSNRFPGLIGGTDRVDLAGVQAGFGSNLNSVVVDPNFISSSDLHINIASASVDNLGTNIAGFTTDIDGDTRCPNGGCPGATANPDMGADEYMYTVCISPPSAGTISSGGSVACGGVILNASGYDPGFGSTYQWQSSTDNVIFNPIAGATTNSYTTYGEAQTMYYKFAVTCSGNTQTTSSFMVAAGSSSIQPLVTGDTRCGLGVVNLSASGNGGTLIWTPASAGPIVNTGTAYNPSVTVSGSLSVRQHAGLTVQNVGYSGMGAIPNGYFSTTTQFVPFNVLATNGLIINSVDIYSNSPVGTPFTIELQDAAGTPYGSVSGTTAYQNTAGISPINPQTVALNFFVPQGNLWRLVPVTNPNMPVFQAGVGHGPSTIPGVILNYGYGDAGGGWTTTSGFFFNWSVSSGCYSTPATVSYIVNDPPVLTITPSGPTEYCGTGSVGLTASGTGYINYNWSPATGLSSTSGASVTANPSVTTTYTLLADDNLGAAGCAATEMVTITVHTAPSANATATTTLVCQGSTSTLSANGASSSVKQLGSSTNPANNTIAVYDSWNSNVKTQILYTQAELNAAGIFGPTNITSIGFQVANKLSAGSLAGFTIRMAPVAVNPPLTTTYQNPAFTQVYTSTYATVLGWNTHIFQNNFVWNGVSNILVEICNGVPSAPGFDQIHNTPTASAQTIQANLLGCASATGNPILNRPNTRFTGGTVNYLWTPNDGNLSATNIESPIFTGNTTGNFPYTVTVTDPSNNCVATSNISLTVNPIPAAPVASNSAHCGMQVPTASVSGAGTMLWYNATGTLLQTGGNTYITAINATTTFYVAALINGCESTPRTPVTVTVSTPPAIVVSSNTTICEGQSTNLLVTSGNDPSYTYTWSPGASLSNPNIANPIASPTVSTTYTVAAVDNTAGPNAGCTTFGSVTITVNPAPVVTATAQSTTICGSGSTTLGVTDNLGNVLATVGTGTIVNTITTYPAPYGNYWWGARHQFLIPASELTNAGLLAGPLNSLAFDLASAYAGDPMEGFTIKLGHTALSNLTTFQAGLTTVYSNASQTLTGTGWITHPFSSAFNWDGSSGIIVEVCFNNTDYLDNAVVRQSATAYTSTVHYRADATGVCANASVTGTFNQRPNMRIGQPVVPGYSWSPSAGLSNPNIKNPIATVSSTTTYTVTVTNPITGCTKQSDITLNVVPAPSAVITPSGPTTFCFGQNVTLAAGTGTGWTYLWSTFETTQSILVDQAGSYTVSISSPGCSPVQSAPVNVVVSFYTFTPTINSSVNNTPCPAGSYDLSATGPADSLWSWLGPNGFTANTQAVNVTASGLYTVTVDSAGCSSFPVSINVTTNQCQSCATPTGVAHSNVGAGKADISWSPAYIGDSFLIRYWDISTGIYQYKNIPSGQSSTTLDYLDWQNTTYVWQVKTICASPQPYSKYSVTDTFTTVAGTSMPCNYRPILPTTLGVTATTADLIWYPVDADAFIVRYEVAGTFNYKYQAVSGGIGNPSATQLVGLLPSTDYNWWVLGICNGVKSRYSVMGNFQTDAGSIPCIKPFDTRGINIGTTTAMVEWNGIVTADEFRVKYAVNTLPYVWKYKTVSGIPNVNTIPLTGLTANTTYRFQVQTICSGIKSDYSAVEVFTTLANPSGQSRNITEDVRGTLSLSAYPNPARDNVTVSFGADSEGGKYLVRLLDLSGRMLMERNGTAPKGQYQEDLKIEGLAAGMYLLEVRIGEKQGFLRLTVE